MKSTKSSDKKELFFQALIILNTVLIIVLLIFIIGDAHDNLFRHTTTHAEINNLKTQIHQLQK